MLRIIDKCTTVAWYGTARHSLLVVIFQEDALALPGLDLERACVGAVASFIMQFCVDGMAGTDGIYARTREQLLGDCHYCG